MDKDQALEAIQLMHETRTVTRESIIGMKRRQSGSEFHQERRKTKSFLSMCLKKSKGDL